ncbi:MAG: diguanylate cyclase [Gammaproteobacteria bacterium]|nr:diguanylate cyclase [Gammaproteobacteria bacterium]
MTEKLRVLVVDDSRVVLKAFSRILSEDYDVKEASDGEEAWDILRQDDSICGVFTDLNMPHLDGHGLMQRIRSSDDEELKRLPVILVTASDDAEEKTKSALQAGATDFVSKPFDSIYLKAKAKAHIQPREKLVMDEKSVSIDPTTRLLNKRFFFQRGEQEVSEANRHVSELALVLVELDKFEDQFRQTDSKIIKGLLQKIGSFITEEVRVEDTVARLEKARFAILMPHTTLAAAADVAERMRKRIRSKTISNSTTRFDLTASIGVSALPPKVKRSFEMLMLEAERSLQEALNSGGDKVLPAPQVAADKDDVAHKVKLPTLIEAVSMMERREYKLTKVQGVLLFKQLMPLLVFLNQLIGLGLEKQIAEWKQKYGR